MTKQYRNPGDPYDVGFAKPPKRTRFKKGISGNSNGRPRKKPDLYSEMQRVLQEKVTVSINDHKERVTVQQALLFCLRDRALHGEVWAGKLFQKIFNATPEGATEYDSIEREVERFRLSTYLKLIMDEHAEEKPERTLKPSEPSDGR